MTHQDQVAKVERAARRLRWDIVEMIGPNVRGHFGGSLSLADIVAALYFCRMRHDPKNPHWPERDRFLLSKGHSGLVQYAALAECGYFPRAELAKLKTLGSMLQGHPDMRRTPGVECNTGSLGQGLSIACGIAAGLKLDGSKARVYCVVGDGESAEGQIWEAAAAAAHYKLDNLVAILDRNRLQAMGPVAERFNTNPVFEKWEAFGWQVAEADGHDAGAILTALDDLDQFQGKPKMLIARTIKGAGLPFAENQVSFHNGAITSEQYEQARALFCADAAE
jgi:transketolase